MRQAAIQRAPFSAERATDNNTSSRRTEICLGWMLTLIGICALGAIMCMNARFGWSLQDGVVDKVLSATAHTLVDLGAAALVLASSVMLCWRGITWKVAGTVAGICSLILVAYSVLGVYSFMSTRVARLEAHNRLLALEKSDLEWKRGMSVQRNLPKSERLYMRAETKEGLAELKRQIGFLPDAPAQTIAEALGTSPERVQRGLVAIASGIGQFVKLSCLFFGGLILRRRRDLGPPIVPSEPPPGRDGTTGQGQGGTTAKGGTSRAAKAVVPLVPATARNVVPLIPLRPIPDVPRRRFTCDEAILDVTRLVQTKGEVPSQSYLQERWGAPKQTVSRWMKKAEKLRRVARRREGNRMVSSRVGDGGSRHVHYA